MTKLELNNKLAKLYNLPAKKIMMTSVTCTIIDGKQKDTYTTGYALLIDDWAMLMDLALDNKLNIYFSLDVVTCTNNKDVIESNEFMSDNESPQAATRFAIAMALVKLAEDKS